MLKCLLTCVFEMFSSQNIFFFPLSMVHAFLMIKMLSGILHSLNSRVVFNKKKKKSTELTWAT